MCVINLARCLFLLGGVFVVIVILILKIYSFVMNSPTIFNVRSAVLSDLKLSDFYFASERVVYYLGSLFVPSQLKGTLNKDELVFILRAIKPSFPWYSALSKEFLVQSLKRILSDDDDVSN